jgi:hypothetical protein
MIYDDLGATWIRAASVSTHNLRAKVTSGGNAILTKRIIREDLLTLHTIHQVRIDTITG